MIKHLLTAFLIFGFFIAYTQNHQGDFRTSEARFKSLDLVDFPSPYGHMDIGINNQTNFTFRGGVKHRLDRINKEALDRESKLFLLGYCTFTYNTNNQITEFSEKSYSVIPGFFYSSYLENYFYEGGRKIKTEKFEMGENTILLNQTFRTALIYNEKGLVNQINSDVFDRSLDDYKPNTKLARLFDSNDRLIQDTLYLVNPVNGVFEMHYRHEYTYNAQGLLQVYLKYGFDQASSSWKELYRELYSYDVNNYLEQKTFQLWEESLSAFVNVFQGNAVYDVTGGISRITTTKWNPNVNEWENYEKYEFVNDNNYNREDLLLPDLSEDKGVDFNKFNKMLKLETKYNFDTRTNSWSFANNFIYIYSEQTVINTEDTKLEEVSFYPNPVESSLSIRNKKGAGIFELFNVQGQKIIHQEVVGDAQVDLSKQMPGFYFYKMSIGGKSATGKLVKN